MVQDYDDGGWRSQHRLDFPMEFVLYAIFAIFLMIVVLMVKLLCDTTEEDNTGSPTENTALLSAKLEDLFTSSYGTTEEDDVESGTIGSCSTSSEDLYDGKICVICYDDQRNCFFIPCGHCISCNNCAQRITSEEKKSCPICRTIISKVHIL